MVASQLFHHKLPRSQYPNGIVQQSPGLVAVTRERDEGLPQVTDPPPRIFTLYGSVPSHNAAQRFQRKDGPGSGHYPG